MLYHLPTHEQVNAVDRFPNVPLIVISAKNKNVEQIDRAKRGNELYIQMHRELAELSTKSKFIACDTCSHYIHKDKPDLVVSYIKWVLDQGDSK